MRDKRVLAAAAALAILIAGWYGVNYFRAYRTEKRLADCTARTVALDQDLRARFPRAFEHLGEPLVGRSGRCFAILEYHYSPCSKELAKSAPHLCDGPEADIAFYDVDRSRILLSCEKRGEKTSCGEAKYDTDGVLKSFSPIPETEFVAKKGAFLRL